MPSTPRWPTYSPTSGPCWARSASATSRRSPACCASWSGRSTWKSTDLLRFVYLFTGRTKTGPNCAGIIRKDNPSLPAGSGRCYLQQDREAAVADDLSTTSRRPTSVITVGGLSTTDRQEHGDFRRQEVVRRRWSRGARGSGLEQRRPARGALTREPGCAGRINRGSEGAPRLGSANAEIFGRTFELASCYSARSAASNHAVSSSARSSASLRSSASSSASRP